MPNSAQPYDPNYTNFVFGDTPGSGDFDRMQNNLKFLASRPFCMLNRSGTGIVNSSLTPGDLQWDNTVQTTSNPSTQMVVYAAGLTNKIITPYVGDWVVKAKIRAQFNTNTGSTQIFLYKTFTSGHADILLDEDEAPCTATGAVHLRINCDTQIVAADLPNGPGFKIQFVQNSGGSATITTDPTAFNAWPRFSARWEGTSTT